MSIDYLAQQFFDAFYDRRFSGDRSIRIADLSLCDAYRVQDSVTEKRVQIGERVVGYKVGCTSAAIQAQFGLDEPIHGKLFAPHVHKPGAELFFNDYINCSIEPEIVLNIGKDLEGEILSDEMLIDAIESVSPGIEIHHFRFWFHPKTSQELICSNGIHAGLVIGEESVAPQDVSFKDERFEVFKNGRLLASAPASEIMGGPLHALRWLVGHLTRRNLILSAGNIVIPGSPVELVPIDTETEVTVKISHVGRVTVRFRE